MAEIEEKLLAEVSELVKKFDASPKLTAEFNIFEVLNVKEAETKICRFLCELLSPNGSHGMRIFFLKPFVENVLDFNISDEELQSADVSKEFVIENGRRIDILVKTKSHFIPIEVKILASDLNKQCKDYYEEAKKHDTNAKIFYLTPYGKLPSPESSCGVPVKCKSFAKDISGWACYCIKKIDSLDDAERLKHASVYEVLKQYAATLKKFTEKTMKETLTMEIAELISNSDENLKAAGEIVLALVSTLQIKLFENVEKMLKEDEKEYNLVKGEGLHYADKSCEVPGLFYKKTENNDSELGVRLDVEKYYGGTWIYVGEFTLNGRKWGRDKFEKIKFPDEPPASNVDVNFSNPEHLSWLCNKNIIEKVAGDCACKIKKYFEDYSGQNKTDKIFNKETSS